MALEQERAEFARKKANRPAAPKQVVDPPKATPKPEEKSSSWGWGSSIKGLWDKGKKAIGYPQIDAQFADEDMLDTE